MNSYTFPKYSYHNQAVSQKLWARNKYRGTIQSHKITIPQVLRCNLEDNDTVTFLFQNTISFNKPLISDSYNQGPYIDMTNVSFEPLESDDCSCLFDSIFSTPVKDYNANHQSALNKAMNVVIDPLKPSFKVGLNAGQNVVAGTTLKVSEFNDIKYQDNEKRIISYVMSACYSTLNKPRPYNASPLAIKQQKLLRIDTLSVPPLCATSTFGTEWKLNYEFGIGLAQKFKFVTEVQTVFASNDWFQTTELESWTGSDLSWIKTIHKIVLIFSVTINNDKSITIDVIRRGEDRICLTGFNKEIVKIRLRRGDKKTKLNAGNAQKHCSIPLGL